MCEANRKRQKAWFFLILVTYIGLHLIVRCLVSETAGMDDADQVLRAQAGWSWGYGPQPPLYIWLVKIFLGVFGYHIFSLDLLRELLVLALYGLTYATTQRLTRSHLCAVVATAALQFNPTVAWELHRELTNTTLVAVIIVVALYLFMRMEEQTWTSYVAFGIACAAGVLSKYNFLLVYLALMAAAMVSTTYRGRVLNRRMGLAVLITASLCLPHVIWLVHHQSLGFSSLFKLKLATNQSWWMANPEGLKKWLLHLLSNTAPTAVVLGLIFQRSARQIRFTAGEQWLAGMGLWVLGLATFGVFLFKVTGFRDRYVMPLFVWLPILIMGALRDQLTPGRLRVALALSGLSAFVILIAAPGRLFLTESLHKTDLLNMPLRRLARDLQPLVQPADTLIVQNHPLAGNLRLWFPDKLVVSPEVAPLLTRLRGRCVLIWDATLNSDPPASLAAFTKRYAGDPVLAGRRLIEERLKYCRYRAIRLGIAQIQKKGSVL